MNEANQSEDYAAVEFTTVKTARVMSPPDMPDYMIDFVVTRGQELLDGEFGTDDEAVATALKKDMDLKWQPCWHVTVGKNFGSYVVHQKRRFVYFTIGKTAFLVYKAQ